MAMQFLKGLTRWFHFGKTPTTIESGKRIQEVPAEPQQLVTRRNLLFGLGATAIVAAMPEIPVGRVWSFPRIIRTSFADPGRIDMLNLAAWENSPWHEQSLALQLEKVRDKLPLLYERDTQLLFKLLSRVEPVSTRSMRLFDDEIHDYATNGVPLRGTTYDLVEVDGIFKEITLSDAKRLYPQVLSGNIPPAGDDGSHGLFNVQYTSAPSVELESLGVPRPKTESGKVSRLVDRYGDALAEKVDRTVVKPVRDELESICDLVNNG